MKPIEIISYWFSERIQKHWFSSTPELDKEIKTKYERTWVSAAAGELDEWKISPEGCLALIIILDQLPLNMFRGEAKSFETERQAVEVALTAINSGFDKKLSSDKLPFLFMPFMHSEKLEEQDLSVKLYRENNFENNLRFALHHREIVKRFGRFPHRNRIIGRESTKAEKEYLASENSFKG